jgi:hypothetical protein
MANKYTWSIKKMTAHTEDQGHQDVVYNVDWSCSAEDENKNTVSTSGTQFIPFTDGGNFTPADQLNLATVLGWVQTAMGDTVQASIKEQLDALLQEKVQPKTVEISLPWLAS